MRCKAREASEPHGSRRSVQGRRARQARAECRGRRTQLFLPCHGGRSPRPPLHFLSPWATPLRPSSPSTDCILGLSARVRGGCPDCAAEISCGKSFLVNVLRWPFLLLHDALHDWGCFLLNSGSFVA